jgi:hypothetical protein
VDGDNPVKKHDHHKQEHEQRKIIQKRVPDHLRTLMVSWLV